jgi:uncharacterized repeat protein (TIGR01451 family)
VTKKQYYKTNIRSRGSRDRFLSWKFFLLASARCLYLLVPALTLATMHNAQAAGPVDYVLTTPADPVKPGGFAEFDVTVRNLSNKTQFVRLFFTVPQFTTYVGNGTSAGSVTSYTFGNIAASASESAKLLFSIPGGNQAPPEGTIIELTLTDQDRGASTPPHDVVVRSSPVLDLELSSQQGTVAPGQNFTYTLTASNTGVSPATGAQLSLPVPTGATFISADGNGMLVSGIIQWNLGTLAAGANQQLHVTFQVDATQTDAFAAIEAALSDNAGHVARASDNRVVYAVPDFDYSLTTPTDPAKAGKIAEFDVTVRNLTGVAQFMRFYFTVPEFTTYVENGTTAGTVTSYTFGNIAAGTSQSGKLLFSIPGGNQAPPDGTTITLNLMDEDRGALISRSVVIRSAPALKLDLSTGQGTVAPGQQFTYTLVASNSGASALTGLQLRVAVPAGATFVSADANASLGNDGVVQWQLGNLAAGANRQLHLNLQASSIAGTPLGPIEAFLTESGGQVARASDSRVIYTLPNFGYELLVQANPVGAGTKAEFDVTVHNLTGVPQFVRFYFTVPEYTTYSGNGATAGTVTSYTFGNIAAGTSQSAKLLFSIPGGNQAPPDGTTVTVNLMDLDRGASVSRTILVQIPQLANIATRLAVGTGDNVLIGGFIITGGQPKRLIIRGIGPSLPVPGALADPILELHDPSHTIATNDNWIDSADKQAIIDTTIPPSDPHESAILTTLDPGQYTAVLRGVNDTTGIGVVQVYDLDQSVDSILGNISTRGFVQTGDNVMIGGLIIIGSGPTKAAIRAIGPSLGNLGVQGALQDPALELHDGNGAIIGTNDDWQSGQNIAELQSDGLAPADPRESAILQPFSPGQYTAIVRGVGDTTGVALVEVYQLSN